MTRKEYDSIIDNEYMPFRSSEAVSVWEVAEQYMDTLEQRIAELEQPKSCNGCIWFHSKLEEDSKSYCAILQTVVNSDFSCKAYTKKDNQ